jgi:hypothetical protein
MEINIKGTGTSAILEKVRHILKLMSGQKPKTTYLIDD